MSAATNATAASNASGTEGAPWLVRYLEDALGDGCLRDAGAMVAASLGALAWFTVFDFLTTRGWLEGGLSRKLIHVSSGSLFMLTWLLFSSSTEARYFAAAVPLLQGFRVVAIGTGLVTSYTSVRSMSRKGDRRELLGGPLFYIVVTALVTVIFWRTSPVGVTALSLMVGGDGIADIVGRRFGKGNPLPLPFDTSKSFAGSAAMFLGGYGLALCLTLLFNCMEYMDLEAGAAAWRLAVIAAAATVVEALPVGDFIDDNITVPLTALVVGGLVFQRWIEAAAAAAVAAVAVVAAATAAAAARAAATNAAYGAVANAATDAAAANTAKGKTADATSSTAAAGVQKSPSATKGIALSFDGAA